MFKSHVKILVSKYCIMWRWRAGNLGKRDVVILSIDQDQQWAQGIHVGAKSMVRQLAQEG